METKKNKDHMSPEATSALLKEVMAKLKDRKVLFPESMERAKEFLSKVKMKTN